MLQIDRRAYSNFLRKGALTTQRRRNSLAVEEEGEEEEEGADGDDPCNACADSICSKVDKKLA